MNFRDRIKELRRVRASELRDHPMNYRTHGPAQRTRMTGILSELGFVDAVLVRELPDGGLELIDGHMRKDLADDAEIPVLVTDLDEAEAAAALATFDQIGKLSDEDPEKLGQLAASIAAEEADLRRMLDELIVEAERTMADAGEEQPASHKPRSDEMELAPHEHYDYLVVLARTTDDWHRLLDLLEVPVVSRRGRIGAARGFPAARMIQRLEAVQSPTADTQSKGKDGKPKSRRTK
jgi:hypothetical protein